VTAIFREKKIDIQLKADEFERGKEIDVQKADQVLEAALGAGKSVLIGPIDGGRWDLYSAEYFSHYFMEEQETKKLSFHKDVCDDGAIPYICGPDQVSGELHIYLNGTSISVRSFRRPMLLLNPWSLKQLG
jgi:hypothetical protein